jgi:cytochrome P450
LAQHPKVMHALMDELEGTLAGGQPSADLLARMPMLEAVIKESMRILPPVPYTVRAVVEPCGLDDIALAKGDRVILGHYIVHRMPDLYDEPEQFQPERWFRINPDQYEYLPFSAGPRTCIGYGFAMTAIKIALAMILFGFRLTIVPDTRIDRVVKITMRPRYGLPMSIHKQDRGFEAVPVRGNIHEMVKLV